MVNTRPLFENTPGFNMSQYSTIVNRLLKKLKIKNFKTKLTPNNNELGVGKKFLNVYVEERDFERMSDILKGE